MLAVPGTDAPTYEKVQILAEKLAKPGTRELFVCLEADMAKALGHALAARMPKNARILCIDRVRVGENSYLDIGEPVGGAFPVVVKTLVLERRST